MGLIDKACVVYDYTTASIETRDRLRDYLDNRHIRYKFIFYPDLQQWTFTMWLAKPEDFDKIVSRFGVELIKF